MANKDFQNGLIVGLSAGSIKIDTGNIGYQVKFKVDGDDYYIASCEAGETIAEPPEPTMQGGYFGSWQDENNNKILFPYTPAADITLNAALATEALLCHCDDFADSGKNRVSLTGSGINSINILTKKFGFGSWLLNGANGYMSIDNPSTYFDFDTNDFTIDMWIRPTSLSQNQSIFSAWNSDTSKRAWTLTTVSSGVGFYIADGTSSISVQATNVFSVNTWYHLAITRSGANLYLFVNGVLKTTQNIGSLSVRPISTNHLYIGRNANTSSSDGFSGYIDEIRVLNGTCAWTSDFTPPTNPY